MDQDEAALLGQINIISSRSSHVFGPLHRGLMIFTINGFLAPGLWNMNLTVNWSNGSTKKYPVSAVWPAVVVGVGAVKSLAIQKEPCFTGINVPIVLLNVAVVLNGGNCILERCWGGNIPGLPCTPNASNKSHIALFTLFFFALFLFALFFDTLLDRLLSWLSSCRLAHITVPETSPRSRLLKIE